MATIRDVARLAGVSAVTASRALSGTGPVSERTLQLVKHAAHQLHYQPNRSAQGLRTGKTKLILLNAPEKGMYDLLLFDFTSGVTAACKRRGYALSLGGPTVRQTTVCCFGLAFQ